MSISGNLFRAGLHPISTCRPVKTSFQVGIEIYEIKLGQSGDRILARQNLMFGLRVSEKHLSWNNSYLK